MCHVKVLSFQLDRNSLVYLTLAGGVVLKGCLKECLLRFECNNLVAKFDQRPVSSGLLTDISIFRSMAEVSIATFIGLQFYAVLFLHFIFYL